MHLIYSNVVKPGSMDFLTLFPLVFPGKNAALKALGYLFVENKSWFPFSHL